VIEPPARLRTCRPAASCDASDRAADRRAGTPAPLSRLASSWCLSAGSCTAPCRWLPYPPCYTWPWERRLPRCGQYPGKPATNQWLIRFSSPAGCTRPARGLGWLLGWQRLMEEFPAGRSPGGLVCSIVQRVQPPTSSPRSPWHPLAIPPGGQRPCARFSTLLTQLL